jgi:hypothetical protein
MKGLRQMPCHAMVVPPRWRKCGFGFHPEKLRKPSKCPRCQSTCIDESLFSNEVDDWVGVGDRGASGEESAERRMVAMGGFEPPTPSL